MSSTRLGSACGYAIHQRQGVGWSLPLPAKVGESSRFYPDFLWWTSGDACWAIDPTGRHILDAKIPGKLIALEHPRTALVTKGNVDIAANALEEGDGWSIVRARTSLPPTVQYYETCSTCSEALFLGVKRRRSDRSASGSAAFRFPSPSSPSGGDIGDRRP